MTANQTEVMTEEDRQYVENQRYVQKTGSFEKSYFRFIAIIDKLLAENASLRSSRDEAVKELDRPIEGYLDAERTIGLKWSRRGDYAAKFAVMMLSQKCELEAKVARLEAGHRESERQFAAKCDEIGKLMEEVSRLSGELASRPAKELVEAESMMVKHLRKLLGGPGTDSIDLRPSRLRAAEQLVAMSSTLKHTQALSDCCHCLVKVGGLWLKELVEGIDSALSQASSADAISAPAKEGVVTHLQPYVRDVLGRKVREVWITWAKERPHPKASWLEPYDNLEECDKEADRMIGEELARHFALFGNPFSPAPVAGETRTCAICGQSGRDMRQLEKTEKFVTLLGTVGISAYAWVCKSHKVEPKWPVDGCHCISPLVGSWGDLPPDRIKPYTLDHFSAAKNCPDCGGTGRRPSGDTNASAVSPTALCPECGQDAHGPNVVCSRAAKVEVSPASEEKDAKAQVGGIPSGTGVVAGLVMASTEGIAGVSPTPAPAPSEDYPGVRVKGDKYGAWFYGASTGDWYAQWDFDVIKKSQVAYDANGTTELHGPERLAVIEKAVRLRSDLFGKQESPTTEEDNIRRIVRDELARHGMVLK